MMTGQTLAATTTTSHRHGDHEIRTDPVTGVQYYVEYIEKIVPRMEVRMEEKIVPRYEVQYVEKLVEVPEVKYVQVYVEVPHVEVVEKLVVIPQVEVRTSYVEVPVVEELVVQNRVVQTVEVPEYVKRQTVQYVEKIVEIPHVRYDEVYQEYDEVVEQIKYVPKAVVQQRPVEVIKQVRKEVVVPREQVVEVAGPRVEVPVPQMVDVPVPHTTFKDTPWPVVVAQKLVPILINDCVEETEVEVKQYVPYIVPVDVYVPRAVQLPYVMGAAKIEEHVVTGIPVAHWNGLVHRLNPALLAELQLMGYLPVLHEQDGSAPVAHNPPLVHPIVSIDRIRGYTEFLEYLKRLAVPGTIAVGPANTGRPNGRSNLVTSQ